MNANDAIAINEVKTSKVITNDSRLLAKNLLIKTNIVTIPCKYVHGSERSIYSVI
jgi:hypothetical protein